MPLSAAALDSISVTLLETVKRCACDPYNCHAQQYSLLPPHACGFVIASHSGDKYIVLFALSISTHSTFKAGKMFNHKFAH